MCENPYSTQGSQFSWTPETRVDGSRLQQFCWIESRHDSPSISKLPDFSSICVGWRRCNWPLVIGHPYRHSATDSNDWPVVLRIRNHTKWLTVGEITPATAVAGLPQSILHEVAGIMEAKWAMWKKITSSHQFVFVSQSYPISPWKHFVNIHTKWKKHSI